MWSSLSALPSALFRSWMWRMVICQQQSRESSPPKTIQPSSAVLLCPPHNHLRMESKLEFFFEQLHRTAVLDCVFFPLLQTLASHHLDPASLILALRNCYIANRTQNLFYFFGNIILSKKNLKRHKRNLFKVVWKKDYKYILLTFLVVNW